MHPNETQPSAAAPAAETPGRPRVTVIVPVAEVNDYVRESLPRIAAQGPDVEILLVPDEDTGESFTATRVVPSGPIGPAAKRDMAAAEARGEFLAFLDDDAYPAPGWLEAALERFKDPEVAAVGGPAVTPADEPLMRAASGAVYESRLASGGYVYRYLPRPARLVDDYPTVNLIVRADVFRRLGGFKSEWWPGEDTKLCLDMTKGLGHKIVYDPKVFVWHHRRPLFWRHFRQVAGYALHRGHFARVYPQTSLRPAYFVPSLFVVFLVAGPLAALAWRPAGWIWAAVMGLYGALVVGAAARHLARPALAALVAVGIVLTHIVYGVLFVAGLAAPRLRH